ncbi:MAG: TonB-dependent receptor [Lentimicrobiaceae bacterium]|nr:TonB-dependent receptor [Lentimicrobiaceae bacterium]
MKKSAKICFICVICVLSLPHFQGSLYAQHNALDTTKVYEIKEVAITTTLHNEIIPSQKLSAEELHRLSSHSVADAIRYFSGIQIKDFGGIGGLKTVDIRSMGTNHVGVFYDGIQLGNAQNGQIDLGKFSLDNIEEITLYNGQKSEIFQSAKDFGFSGNIYLKTKRPTFEKDKKFNVRAIFRTGSFGLANPSMVWEQKITKTLSSSINAEYTYATGKYRFRYRRVLPDGTTAYDTTAVRQNGDIQAVRVEGGLFGNAKKLLWNAKIYFYNSERGIPGAILNNVWKNAQRQWDRNFFTQASIVAPIHPRYTLQAHFKYANDYMRYLNPDTTLLYIDNNFTQQEIYSSLSQKVNILKNWEIALSTDFQWNSLQANLKNFAQPDRYSTLVALATAYHFWRIKMQASLLGTFINDKRNQTGSMMLPENIASSSQKRFSPAVFISYKPIKKEEFHIRTFYKRAFRMPTFNDLYYTDIGNIALKPELATQYNVGLQYTKIFKKGIIEMLMLKTDLYYNEIKDKIIAVPKGSNQFRWMMMNIGLVKIKGVDAVAQLDWKFPYDIRLKTIFNYTFQKAQDFSDPKDNDPYSGTYGGQIAYIPWHNGSFTLNFSIKTYELNYCFIYVGERYHNSSNIRENYEQPWYTHDISLGKEFRFKKWNFKISAEINNILNQQYEVVLNYPMPGTNFKIVLRFEI